MNGILETEILSSDFAPAHTYNAVGQYEVTLVVSDSLGCLSSDTSSIIIDVLALIMQ